MKKPSLFLSCDWGTSSFRLRLVEVPCNVLADESNANGMKCMYAAWKETGKPESERLLFYLDFLLTHINHLAGKAGHPLSGIPLILSGMGSSAMGMLELPYKLLPFAADGTDLPVHSLASTKYFPHEIVMVSGIKSDDDVMRGEEVQLVGCFDDSDVGEMVFLFPGTHSKHIRVVNGRVIEFQTYMTGELFQLLSVRSILSATIEKPPVEFTDEHWQCFLEGINDSENFNPLRAFFFVRTNHLFDKMSKAENFFYLSGLLIGLELKELEFDAAVPIILVTNEAMRPFYTLALQQLDFAYNLQIKDVDKAIVRGHYKVFQLMKKTSSQLITL